LARADGIVLAEAIESTRDVPSDQGAATQSARVAETPFRMIQRIAGVAPDGTFPLAAERQPQRYARGQRAILLLSRTSHGWLAVQPAGAGLVLAGPLDRDEAARLGEIWSARNGPPDSLAHSLRRALRSSIAKVRLWAALDLAELVEHGAPLASQTLVALRRDVADPEIDPAVRTALRVVVTERDPPPS
jgi:hypothetical protein